MKKISIVLATVFFCRPTFCQERFLPNLVKNWTVAGNIIVSAIIRDNSEIGTYNYWPTQFIDWSNSPDVTEEKEYLALYEPGKEQTKNESFYRISGDRLYANYIRAKNGSSYCPLFEYRNYELHRSSNYAFWTVCKEGKFIEISTKVLTQSDILLGNSNAKPEPKDIWHIEYNDYGAPVLIWRDEIRYSFIWDGNNVCVESRKPDFISIHKYVFDQSSDASECYEVKDYKFDAIDNEFILIGTHLSKDGQQKKYSKKDREREALSPDYDGIPYNEVRVKPLFQGGNANSFAVWVNERLEYPESAKEIGLQGRVTLQFTIETDGSVTNVKLLRGVDSSIDNEAIRVVSSSPKWKPGMIDGKPVKVTYTFPVIFRLE